MIERHQRLCVWAGIGFAPVFAIGFALVAGFGLPQPLGRARRGVRQPRGLHEDRSAGMERRARLVPALRVVWMVTMTVLMLRAGRRVEVSEPELAAIAPAPLVAA